MRRRALLAAGLTAASGCLGVSTGSPETTTDTPTTTTAVPDRLAVRVENRAGGPAEFTVTLTRIAAPACRFVDPPCESPSAETTAFERTYNLDVGESTAATAPLSRAADALDTYVFAVETADGSRVELTGVEPSPPAGADVDGSDYAWTAEPSATLVAAVEPGGTPTAHVA